ncbi:Ig-like domain-containing protein [Cohnella hongkongensis]|uniref:Ig-like domain-containing protein n=1 Tax=Cohnella hongkongensis TaxID=178337 RepID=A0ABV9FCK5_9BACL
MQRIRMLSLILTVALLLQTFSLPAADAAPGGPLVVSMTPSNGATAAVTTTNLVLTFDEEIVRGTGMIQLYNADSGALVEQYNIADTSPPSVQLDHQNKSIVMTPTGGLTSGARYSVVVPAGAVRNYSDNAPFAGIPNGQWSFRAEQLAPVATNFVPADRFETLDPVNPGHLSFEFARSVVKGSGYIQIKRASDHVTVHSTSVQAADVSIASAGANWRVSLPLKGLEYGASYYVLIDSGALVDPLNGAYAGIQTPSGPGSWTFKTKPALDTTKPKVVTFSPANNGVLSNVNATEISMVFDEPVFANANRSVAIMSGAGNALVCTIPASSTASGTANVVFNLSAASCPSLMNNTDYTVQIGSDVYRDASGNYFDGVTWKFKVLKDTAPPAVSSYFPAVSATAISTSLNELSLTFNEPLGPLASSATAEIFPQNAPASKRNLTMSIDPANNQRVILRLTGSAKLSNSTLYSVTVPANVIQDTSGNFFAGITNPHQWTFRTGTNSVPVITSSTISGAAVVLTFSENLDSSKTPNASNFYATVNDSARAVTSVSVSGNEVRLNLQSSVLVGQTVRLSYYPDTNAARRLQNTSGNEVASFTNRVLTNSTNSTLPRPENGHFFGNTLTLTFNQPMADVAPSFQSQILGQFTVKQNGNVIGINSAFLNGSFLNLTLNSSSTSPLPVSVSYAPGAYPLRDPSGSMVPAFTDFYVRNQYDNESPQLTSAALNGSKIVMTFNEGLNPNSVPPTSAFSVVTTGVTPPTVNKVTVTNNTIELTLSQSVSSNVPVLLYYYQSSPAIMDLSGNIAPAIVGYNFTSGSSDVAQLASSSILNNQLTLVYSAPLNANTAPYASQYTVKYDGTTVPVTGVSVAGTQVVLNLSSPVGAGQTVTLSYTTSGNPLRDTLDRIVGALNNITVGAQTGTPIANLPDYLESDNAGAVRLVISKAVTTTAAVTPSGKAAKRYTVDANKLAASYALIKSNSGVTVPRVSIRIPSTEAGALVSLPIQSLISSASNVSNAEFLLDFGDVQFNLPLNAINFTRQLQQIGGNGSSDAMLQLSIEKVTDTSFIAALAGQGAQRVTTPADFTASILFGGREHPVNSYERYVTRSFVIPSSAGSLGSLSVVHLDSETGKISYVPTTVTNSGTSLYVNFMRKSNSKYAVVRRTAQYADMRGHWANNDVSLLASKFIIDGTTPTTFAPKTSITRADFAQYIVRGLGLNGDRSSANKFSDVSGSGATASYIGAASAAGIVQGGTDGKFRPNAPITREEMATMMVRAMTVAGVQQSPDSSNLNRFSDRGSISSWARDGVSISVQAGIIGGVTPTTMKPKSNATRAEAVVMIKRLLEFVEFIDS